MMSRITLLVDNISLSIYPIHDVENIFSIDRLIIKYLYIDYNMVTVIRNNVSMCLTKSITDFALHVIVV